LFENRYQDKSETGPTSKRWKTFIEPLIPYTQGNGRKFVDLGCSEGFYCRKMIEKGFKTVGMDLNVKYAKEWEEEDPKGIKLIEGDINQWDVPLCHIACLALVHYWQKSEDLDKLIELLRFRAGFVIVMGRHKPSSTHKSDCRKEEVLRLFKNFKFVKIIEGEKHYSILFRNRKIIERPTRKLFHLVGNSRSFYPRFRQFIYAVLSSKEDFNPYKHRYYKVLKAKVMRHKLLDHVKLIEDVNKNREFKTPIKVCHRKKIVDGCHRIILAHELKIETLLCEEVSFG